MPKKNKSKQLESKAISRVSPSNFYDRFRFGGENKTAKNTNLEVRQAVDEDDSIKSTIQVPKFWTYWNYYQIFDEVVSCVDLITKITTNLGLKFYNKDKEEVELDFTEKLADGYHTFNELFCQNILVYGQAMPTIFENEEKELYLRNIPAHQVSLFQAKRFKIDSFWWIYAGEVISKKVNAGSFKVFKKANISSQYFGLSPLNTLYDELNTLNLDNQNFNKFLENNSFFGTVIFAKDGLDLEELSILKRMESELVKSENRYKASVVYGVDKIEQIKQGIEHRLSIADKQYIKDSIYQVYGVPTFFGNPNTGALGSGEQITHRQNLKDLAIVQMQKKLEELYNSWVLPIFYPEHTAKAVQMQVESDSDIINRYTEGYKNGIWTAKQVKMLGYRIDEQETTEEDNFRVMPNNLTVIKEGELKEGNSDEGLTDNVDEKIDDETLVQTVRESVEDEIKDQNAPEQKEIIVENPVETKLEKQAEPVKIINNLKPFAVDVEPLTFTEPKLKEDTGKRKLLETAKEVWTDQDQKESESKVNGYSKFNKNDLPKFSVQQKKKLFSFLDSVKGQNREYSLCDQILLGTQKDELKNQVKGILKKMYKIDLSPLKKNVELKAGFEDEIDYTSENIADYVNILVQDDKKAWLPISNSFLYYLNLGKEDVLRQAKEQGKNDFTQDDRTAVNNSFDEYTAQRLNSLSGLENKPNSKDVRNPGFENSILDTTRNNLIEIIDRAYQNLTSNTDFEAEINQAIEVDIDNRSELIASNEAITAFGAGSAISAGEFGAKKKQWLPSISKERRLNHQAIYGEIVDYNKPFSIGYPFPNTEINCKCGIKVFFDNETQN